MEQRTVWTDERLNDSFDALRTDLGELRMDIRGLNTRLDTRFDFLVEELRAVRETMDRRFDALQRQLLMLAIAMIAVLVGALL